MPSRSFTTTSSVLLRLLRNECWVSKAWDPHGGEPEPPEQEFVAIWDTGATSTMITQDVVDALGLQPVGERTIYHAAGAAEDVPEYLVNLTLANRVRVLGVRAVKGNFLGGHVLVGMDIISQGDFAISNLDGKTQFTFRIPSRASFDFVKEDNARELGMSRQVRRQLEREEKKQRRKS